MSKYKDVGHLAKAEYIKTGSLSAAARAANVQPSTIKMWVAKHGWQYIVERDRSMSLDPLSEFRRRLDTALSATEANAADRLEEIKVWSSLVLQWQRYRDESAAAERKEAREAVAGIDKPALFLDFLGFLSKEYLAWATAGEQERWAEFLPYVAEKFKQLK
jgi:hypothetical protein